MREGYPVYRGIPLYKDVIIITKDNRTIIGLLQKVTPDDKEGDILRICYDDGTLEHININDIDEIDLYIKEENRMIYNVFYDYENIIEVLDKIIGLEIKISTIDNETFNGKLIEVDNTRIKLNGKQNERWNIRKSGIRSLSIDNHEYYLRMTQKDNSRFFDFTKAKVLNYKDLDGKTLKMTVVDNDECLLVAGIDKENNTIYMLHSEVK
jgi:small nuclear ribonucleoprotein (snRNP)-like protein